MISNNVSYASITANIPFVMQSLYIEHIKKSTSLSEIRDAFRIDQIKGKAWMLDQLKDVDRRSNVLVVGSWFGFTSLCLFREGFNLITETDPDVRLADFSMHLNRENRSFRHLTYDVNELDLSSFDLIINTSCEHIDDDNWFDKISLGSFVLLQSTNFKSADHVNTVESLEEMKSKYPLDYTYTGTIVFNPSFSRFMVCGIKI